MSFIFPNLKGITKCAVEQQKLVELVPLSAAGISLQAGQIHFEKFADAMGARLEAAVSNAMAARHERRDGQDVNSEKRTIDGYQLFLWGGR